MGTNKKDPNAVALGSKGGKARAKKMSAEALSAIGRKGAKARFQSLDESRRRDIARKAAQSRWGNRRKQEEE
jgi:hypothetical protein